jgi:hypothetical protein
MSNPTVPTSSGKAACGAALAAALVAGAGLFFEPAALAPGQQAAVEQLLAHADARVVGEASSCCLATPPESR